MKHSIGRTDQLADGEMKEVAVDETPVLLVRIEGTYRAFSARCPHYGGPLAEGVLSEGRITCPWHHACFDARTGGLIDPPAFDALAVYDLLVDGNELFVELPEKPADRRALPGKTIRHGVGE